MEDYSLHFLGKGKVLLCLALIIILFDHIAVKYWRNRPPTKVLLILYFIFSFEFFLCLTFYIDEEIHKDQSHRIGFECESLSKEILVLKRMFNHLHFRFIEGVLQKWIMLGVAFPVSCGSCVFWNLGFYILKRTISHSHICLNSKQFFLGPLQFGIDE